jgi:hypothetical protein
MRRLGVIVLVVVVMSGSVFGATVGNWYGSATDGTGSWADLYWNTARTLGPPAPPQAAGDEIKLTRAITVCTVNTNVGEYLCKLSIAGSDTVPNVAPKLEIVNGGYIGMGEIRVGSGGSTAGGTIGRVSQTGGVLNLNDNLMIGRFGTSGSNPNNGIGYYTISGGTIQYAAANTKGNLYIAGAGASGASEGTFTVSGIDPNIILRKLYVGSDGTNTGGKGTIEFQIDANGVSPIRLTEPNSIILDAKGADSTANLLVSLKDAPPVGDILLVENTSTGAVNGIFDTVNGEPAPEGTPVVMTCTKGEYYYHLTYAGGNNGNDIVLVFDNAVLKPIGPVHSYNFEDGTANDSVGDANGTLVGNAAVVNGSLVLDGNGDWMAMPGDIIAINTYAEVTIEAWFTPVAGGNTGFHMLAAFGEEGTGAANWAGYKYLFFTPARGDDVSRAAIQTRSMDDSPWDDETGVSATREHDDGLQHHFVCTVTATDIAFYIDGVLIGTKPLDAGNAISGISTAVAYLGKGVYPVDPVWKGSIQEFNIYDRALSADEIAANYAKGPAKNV